MRDGVMVQAPKEMGECGGVWHVSPDKIEEVTADLVNTAGHSSRFTMCQSVRIVLN